MRQNNIKTKYIGAAYRCHRCEQHTTNRHWYMYTYGGPPFQSHVIRVAYLCPECVEPFFHDGNNNRRITAPGKKELLIELATLTLLG